MSLFEMRCTALYCARCHGPGQPSEIPKVKILLDGNRLPAKLKTSFEHSSPPSKDKRPVCFAVDAQAVTKGDSKVASIAAASIIAKVTRDRLMEELHRLYPIYDFATHKGYPTASHVAVSQAKGLHKNRNIASDMQCCFT